MRRTTTWCLGLALLVTSCGSGAGVQELTISDAWARPTPSGSDVAAVYMQITTPIDDELIGVSTSAATVAAVHATSVSDSGDGSYSDHSHHGSGGAEIKMSDSTVVLKKNSTVRLEPGGLHVILEGLVQELLEGESFELHLTFRNAGKQTVVVQVSTNPPPE
ncbi:MAG: copper chaperone PCu(A)C [Actinomycetota bacterium]